MEEKKTFQQILSILKDIDKKIEFLSERRIYTNKDIKELLGIEDKLLKKYRDEGNLSFSKKGDKFWYTHEDVLDFINKFKHSSFY